MFMDGVMTITVKGENFFILDFERDFLGIVEKFIGSDAKDALEQYFVDTRSIIEYLEEKASD